MAIVEATQAVFQSGSKSGRLRVVIVGAGFGGLDAAKGLSRAAVDLTIVDRRNHHLFQPLLYQVATAALNPSDIGRPIRRILRHQANASVILADATAIDAANRRLILADGVIAYDYLIVATGATHAYFGHDEWAEHAPGLKTLEDAVEIRRRVLLAYEAAEREMDPARRADWLTFAVVGAGPTGVELAGSLAEISRHVFSRDFRNFDSREARILLIEAGPRVLATFPESLSERARVDLQRLGVEVLLGTTVTKIDAEGLNLGDRRIAARTILWAAGVAASPLARSLGVPLDRAGRVRVEPDLSIPGHPEVFAIGDVTSVIQEDGRPVPGVSPAAMQEGKHAARQIVRTLAGRPREPFRYFDKGSLATIGRSTAVADLGRIRLCGFVAWLAWLLIHIVFLIGFRNRAVVLFQWAIVYLTFDRGARLITGPVRDLLDPGAIHRRTPEDGPAAP